MKPGELLALETGELSVHDQNDDDAQVAYGKSQGGKRTPQSRLLCSLRWQVLRASAGGTC